MDRELTHAECEKVRQFLQSGEIVESNDTPQTMEALRKGMGLPLYIVIYLTRTRMRLERALAAKERELREAVRMAERVQAAWEQFCDSIVCSDASEEMTERQSDLFCLVGETIRMATRRANESPAPAGEGEK